MPNTHRCATIGSVANMAGLSLWVAQKGVGQWYRHISAGGAGCGMARKLRVEYPGAIYHLMNRGDRREPIFKDDEDRQRFLGTLAAGRSR
jgi:hypothetical protein